MLLNRAEKNPSFVLRDRRCLKPRFIEELLELCDNVALTSPPEAPALAVTSSIPEL